MAIFEWRKFPFVELRHTTDGNKIKDTIGEAEVTCATSSNNNLILCDSFGRINIFSKNWDAQTVAGHDGAISNCDVARQINILVTIGPAQDDPESNLVYKVWALLGSLVKKNITLLKSVKLTQPAPTVLAVAENGQYLAIGYQRGYIALYRGDIARDRSSKNIKLLTAGNTPITGLGFRQTGKITQLFTCSDSGVYIFGLQYKDKEIKTILDNESAPTRCSALQTSQQSSETHFMVGRDDAIYCYTTDGLGPCYPLDGPKVMIQWFRHHLLAITKPTIKSPTSPQSDCILTVFDIQNKFIVYSAPITSVVSIVKEFGTCYVITSKNEIFHLDEKDLQSKLALLFKKSLYDIAVRIAKNNQYDAEGLADIFKQYGDHLYSKGLFQGAVEQYSKTIGYLEPSYIIRKFLDTRHIAHLIEYLQALHKEKVATSQHTTLLLNCFTRLDSLDELTKFLNDGHNSDLQFDLDVAIEVCRHASVEHALDLAKRNHKHDICLSILVDDMKNYLEAMNYIGNLSLSEAGPILKKYGYILMDKFPIETTEMLKTLCTTVKSPDVPVDILEYNFDQAPAKPEELIHMFRNSPERLINFLEHLLESLPDCSITIYNTLTEHYLKCWKNDTEVENKLREILKKGDKYDIDHILILCRCYDYWTGIMHIYEEQKLYHLIVHHHLKNGNYEELLNCCKRLGTEHPELWLQTLTGLRNKSNAPPHLMSLVLQEISKKSLQSPLQVLKCLTIEEGGPVLSSARDYFLQTFQKEIEVQKRLDELVKKYVDDAKTLKSHIKNLAEKAIECRSTICSTCQQPLSLPTLYFLCQHAYHQDCLRGYSDSEKDCPVCHKRNAQLIEILSEQNAKRDQHELFHNALDRAEDPFDVIGEYFGRGLFNNIVIIENNDQQNKSSVSHPSKKQNISPKQTTLSEGKLRIMESTAKSFQTDSKHNRIPITESRMRTLETSRYSSSLEANISTPPKPFMKPTVSKAVSSGNTKNPFEDEEVKSGNPFEDEADEAISTNPFGEYDNNLNPFE